MKKSLCFALIFLFFFSCSHPDFNKDGGSRIIVEANLRDMLKPYIQTDDSIAGAEINETYKEYYKQDKPFLELYFDKLEVAVPSVVMGKHFKGNGLTSGASVSECKIYFEKKLTEAMDNVIMILNKRIDAFGISGQIIRKGDKAERLIVELPGKHDMQRIRKLLYSSAKLEFWETYDNQDMFDKLNSLNKSLSKELYPDYIKDTVAVEPTPEPKPAGKSGSLEEQLASQENKKQNVVSTLSHWNQQKENLMKSNPLYAILSPAVKYDEKRNFSGLSPGPLVGYGLAKDTSKINYYLNMLSSKKIFGRYTKFLWTFKPLENSDAYSLIAIKVRRNGAAPLSGDIIENARKIFDSQAGGAPQISVTMTQQAGWDWKNLTHDNVGKSIAIVIDNQVYSYPTVISEISGGMSSITGNFTNAETDDFVNVLKAGYLPLHLNIVQEDLVPPLAK